MDHPLFGLTPATETNVDEITLDNCIYSIMAKKTDRQRQTDRLTQHAVEPLLALQQLVYHSEEDREGRQTDRQTRQCSDSERDTVSCMPTCKAWVCHTSKAACVIQGPQTPERVLQACPLSHIESCLCDTRPTDSRACATVLPPATHRKLPV